MQVLINHEGKTHTLDADPAGTAFELMAKCEELTLVPGYFWLDFGGKRLDGSRTLASYGVSKDSTVHVRLRGRGGALNEDDEYETMLEAEQEELKRKLEAEQVELKRKLRKLEEARTGAKRQKRPTPPGEAARPPPPVCRRAPFAE
jgi:hypothetical protein